jgi:hypothetical protein
VEGSRIVARAVTVDVIVTPNTVVNETIVLVDKFVETKLVVTEVRVEDFVNVETAETVEVTISVVVGVVEVDVCVKGARTVSGTPLENSPVPSSYK